MRFAYSDRAAGIPAASIMNDKSSTIIEKARQERKRAQFTRALKRLEQGIAAYPTELGLYLEAIDTALEGGELLTATNLLKTVQDKFAKERESVQQFVREKLRTVHDPTLARCAVEDAVKRRDLEGALDMLTDVPEHTIRELINRARKKAESLKSAAGAYGLRGEAVVNELTNAILSARLGNIDEAMTTFEKVIDEKPVEHRALDTFLAGLATKYPKSGCVRQARACALIAGANEIDAIHLFIEAARLEPARAATSIERLRAVLEKATHPDKVRHALAEIQLLSGDIDGAEQTLRDYLHNNPDNARDVIMLVRPFIDPARGLNACTWLALEQSLALDQSSLALELMRPIQAAGHTTELLQWLDEHPLPSPPAEIRIFHASLVLELKQFERAAGMLGDVCAAAPQDIPAVMTLIERYRNADASLDLLHKKYAPVEESPAVSESSNDDEGFQSFEANEFRLEKSADAPASSSNTPAVKPKPRFNSSPFSSQSNENESSSSRANKPFIERTELSFDDDGTVHREDDSNEITEEHVTNVAQKLYEVGAAAFFHIDGESGAAAESDVMSDAESPAEATHASSSNGSTGEAYIPASAHAAPGAPAPASPAKESFEQRFERFSRGELSNSAVLELLEEAVEDGRAEQMHELLSFEPATGEEHFARYYFQAEYHLLCNRPMQALEILARLDTPGLESGQKQRVWFKIASAQRTIHNYSGASETLNRLIQAFPDREDYTRLKRRNSEQLVESQSLAATTLEKTSSLD